MRMAFVSSDGLKVMKKMLLILAALLSILPLNGCGQKGVSSEKALQGKKEIILDVSAAASLKDVLTEVRKMYEEKNPGIRLRFNFASSGTLQRQIEQGAPADLFFSAGEEQMDALVKQDLVENPVIISGNRLALIAPAGEPIEIGSLEDILSRKLDKIAIGNPDTVPAGEYTEEALQKTGLYEKLSSKLVFAKDVRQVLAYVETGNADAGFVYRSDAVLSKNVKTLFIIPSGLHRPIKYPGAVIKGSDHREQAEDFLEFMGEEEVRKVFQKYGFSVPGAE
ncbi:MULTISPECIES: molybdate ABC transporter substrate-binding protein [Thermincola]|nr:MULTISPECIES: molybdate ABC transporter substrate-binding protein [Thermincola]